MPGRVVELCVADRAGEPVRRPSAVDVVVGGGVADDRYALGTGHWSDPRWPDQEVTLVEAEVAERLGLPASLLRRNVVTGDVRLPSLIGARFRIGTAELRGVRPCDPCRYLEELLGRPGLRAALAGTDGGLRAEVLVPGRISVGDAVEPLAATTAP